MDSSIYGAMCTMADTADGRNAPEVAATGCFGKAWSNGVTVPPAAQRYTEAALSRVSANCFFNGINENAVDFVDNFDSSSQEPVLLPIAFPNIIVNTSSGVACGLRTYIPCYTLENACKATIGLLKGTVKSEQDLVDLLDAPDFQTGGVINMTNNQKLELVRHGATKGIYITSRYKFDAKTNQLTIYEIPFNTCCEKITEQITDCIKERRIPGITRVVNGADKDGLGIVVFLQNNVKPEDVFKFLCAYTDVQTRISFQTKFVNIEPNGEFMYKEVGILELLNDYWIPWRIDVLKRIATTKVGKIDDERNRLNGFIIIGDRMPEYVDIIMKNTEADAKVKHFAAFPGLNEEQEEYLLDCNIRSLTLDGVLRAKAKLDKLTADANDLHDYINSDARVKKQIIQELEMIAKKYALPRRSSSETESTLIQLTKEEATAVNSDTVWVGLTEKGKIKKATTKAESSHFPNKVEANDKLVTVFEAKNNEKALVFTTAGFIYKMPISQLDSSSRTMFKESVWRFITKDKADMHKELVKKSDVFYASPSGDTPNGFNIVYKNGLVRCIRADMYNTTRNTYKNVFPEVDKTNAEVVTYDGMVFITTDGRATIRDISYMREEGVNTRGKTTLKLPKMKEDETIYKVYPLENLKGVATEDEINYFMNKTWLVANRKVKLLDMIAKADILKKRAEEQAQLALEKEAAEAEELLATEEPITELEKSEEALSEYKESDFDVEDDEEFESEE